MLDKLIRHSLVIVAILTMAVGFDWMFVPSDTAERNEVAYRAWTKGQPTYLRCDAARRNDRHRLDFDLVRANRPEIAETFMLVRDRARDLRAENLIYAQRNLVRHLWMNFCVFAAVLWLVVACWPRRGEAASASLKDWVASLWGFGPARIGLVCLLLLGGLAQSVGYEKKFGAAFVASRTYDGIVMRIDSAVLNAVQARPTGPLDDETRTALAALVQTFATDVAKARKTFAEAFVGSFEPLKPPLPGLDA